MAASLSLLPLIVSILLATPPVYSERRGFRATMIHTEKATDFTQAARKSHERLLMLAARLDLASSGRVSTPTPLQVDAGGSEYNMEFSVGTPPQKLRALADTGSDLTWIKCGACGNCTPQGSPYYPNMSSSFSKLPCSGCLCGALRATFSSLPCRAPSAECEYRYSYGVEDDPHVYTKGYLGSETFTLGSDPVLGGDAVPGVGFGCTTMSEGIYGTSSGIVGLGRGPLSLVSQLNVGAFSYCLTSDPSKTSPLLFGSLAALTGAGVQSTPLLATGGTYYSVNLMRISVGAVTTLGPGRSGYGMVLDSGATLTFLAEPFYTLAKEAVLNQTALPRAADRSGFEACFQTCAGGVSSAVPSMVMHFDGADMALPATSCFGQVDDGVICWMVQRSPSLSIIGNLMQRDYHIRYDVDAAVLSFLPANCDSL